MSDDKLTRMEFEALCHKLGLSPEKYLSVAYYSDSNAMCAFEIYNAAVRATAEECKKSCKELEESFSMTSAAASIGCGRCAEEISDRFGLEE